MIKKSLLYSGLEKDEFEQIRYLFNRPNWLILNGFSITLCLLFLMYIIAGVFNSAILHTQIGLSIFTVLLFGIVLLSIHKGKTNPKLVNILIVIMSAVAYAAAIYNGGVAEKDNYALTFIVMLFVIPMIFMLPPYVQMIEMLIADIIFLIIVYHVKSADLFVIEMMDTVAASLIGSVICIISMRIRAKGYFAEHRAIQESNAKSEFLFNMSHDIRTPMNAIIGFTKLAKDHIDDKEQVVDYLDKIATSNEFLLSVINNVLEMARIESGKEAIDEEPCDMLEMGKSIVTMFAADMEEKGVEFSTDVQVKNIHIYADETKIQKIMLNLLSNAEKYTPAGGSVKMTIKELPCDKPGYTIYENVIEDTGIGMSEEFMEHLFEPFTRERNTTESKILGTGLGMPIVKKLVDLMNGTIEVESEVGKGTRFTFTTMHRIVEDTSLVHMKDAFDESRVHLFKGKRILLAEDNELNAEIAITILEEAGFIVERAEDGIVCIKMVGNADVGYYDAILMDIQMPNMDGYTATQKIRKLSDKAKATIPIVAMTANAFDEDRKKAYDVGMNGFIAKPIKVDEVFGQLQKVLL